MMLSVSSAALSGDSAFLYLTDGSVNIIKKNSPDYEKVALELIPQLMKSSPVEFELNTSQIYEKIKKKTGISFFQMAYEFLDKLFSSDTPEKVLALHMKQIMEEELQQPEDPSKASQISTKGVDTVVAKVGDKYVAGVEKLKLYLENAVKFKTEKNIEVFLQRIANRMTNYQIQDLFKFLESADLPLAEDGTIIAYKILDSAGDHYLDCYSHSIPQKVGDYVHIDPELVDKDNSHECSTGLHIARRAYLGGFNGDTCCLVRVKPEDIIAVPDYDCNKIRVCGYYILKELTPYQFEQVKNNKEFTNSSEGKELLGFAIKAPWNPKRDVEQLSNKKIIIKELSSEPEKEIKAEQVDALKKESLDTSAVFKETSIKARLHYLFENLNKKNAELMFDIKKQSRKSFRFFGFSDEEITKIYDALRG